MMSGGSIMRSGPNGPQFFGLNEKGEMKPVKDLLRVTCGDDFGKFARTETTFYYNQLNPSSEIYTDFWFGRKFRVLFVPARTTQKKGGNNKKVVWMNGTVKSWKEYNMGPADYHTKWELNANIEPCDGNDIGLGSLVSMNSQLALVSNVQTDESSGETTYQLYRAENDITTNGHQLHELSNPWSGELTFQIENMNVNGGGIVICESMEKMEHKLLSFEWLGPPRSEETHEDCWYHCPQKEGNGGGDESISIHDPDIIPQRKEMLNLIEEIMVNDVNDGKDPENPNFPKEVRIMRKMYFMAKKKLPSITHFHKHLLCIPSLCYEGVVLSFIEDYDENKKSIKNVNWPLIFQILLNSAILILNDEEWNMSCWHKGMNRVPTEIDSDKEMHFCLSAGLYRLTTKIGEWYEDNDEYRAAIWTYENNLAMSRDKKAMEKKQDRLNSEHTQLYYIALAHKKMGNYLEASKFYEKAILVTGTRNVSSVIKENTKILQEKASQWFGTSGHLTKWSHVNADVNDNVETERLCHVCSEKATSKCSSCRLVSYCSRDCQVKHWSVHKYTCLGKYCQKEE